MQDFIAILQSNFPIYRIPANKAMEFFCAIRVYFGGRLVGQGNIIRRHPVGDKGKKDKAKDEKQKAQKAKKQEQKQKKKQEKRPGNA